MGTRHNPRRHADKEPKHAVLFAVADDQVEMRVRGVVGFRGGVERGGWGVV